MNKFIKAEKVGDIKDEYGNPWSDIRTPENMIVVNQKPEFTPGIPDYSSEPDELALAKKLLEERAAAAKKLAEEQERLKREAEEKRKREEEEERKRKEEAERKLREAEEAARKKAEEEQRKL